MARRPLYVKLRLPERNELYVHKARNLTVAGLFIDAPVPLGPGTRVQLEFRGPHDATIVCDAEVTWNTEMAGEGTRVPHPGFGVVFVGLDEPRRRVLASLIDVE